jgi:HYR domain
MDKLVVIYTLPMVSNTSPMILMMATLACAIITPAAGALLLLPSSSVFAQQQEETSLGEEGEDLGSGIASDVLDSVGVEEDEQEEENDEAAATGDNDDGDTNTQIAVPITDQDQREANLAEQLGLNADILEEEEVIPTPTPTPTPTPEEDTIPPTLTVPGDITEDATSADGAVVTFEVTAQDNVDGTVPVECTPESGSTFPIGVTTVECTATDAAGNTATASFTITVFGFFCFTQNTVGVTQTLCFFSEVECQAGEEIQRERVGVVTIVSSCQGPVPPPDGAALCLIRASVDSIPRSVQCIAIFPLQLQM